MTPADLLYAVETEILKGIAAALGRGAVGTAAWKTDRLARLGVVSKNSAALVARYATQVQSGMASAVEEAAINAALAVDAKAFLAKKAGGDVKELLAITTDPVLRATIETWQRSAKNQANLAMAQMAQNAGDVYMDIINKTTLSVVTGAETGHVALVQTIKEWSKQGIPSIVDRAGRQWTSEAYVNAVIRSNTSRAANESALARAEEYETDLVEVSSHPGSRPSHYDFQGQVFSRSGTHEKYPPLSDTGYGDAGGIGGVNCSHLLYAFWEGVSIAREPAQSEAQNEALYTESQNQRALEREIRSAKRELTVMESLGDDAGILAAKQSVREAQSAMREFVDDTGRTRQYSREQVYDT